MIKKSDDITPKDYMALYTALATEGLFPKFYGQDGNIYIFTTDRFSSIQFRGDNQFVENFTMEGKELADGLEAGIKSALKDPRCLGVVPCSPESRAAVSALGLNITHKVMLTPENIEVTSYR